MDCELKLIIVEIIEQSKWIHRKSKTVVNLKDKSINRYRFIFCINCMATKTKEKTTKKNDKEWLKSIVVTWFFVIVFVCAYFWMDVKKNTPMQFVDKMLAWDLVEKADAKAKDIKTITKNIVSLGWTLSELSLAPSNFMNLELIAQKQSELEELDKAFDDLIDSGTITHFIKSWNQNILDLMSAEKTYIRTSDDFYSFLSYNQDYLWYDDNGNLEIMPIVKDEFDRLLKEWVNSQDALKELKKLF